MASIIDTTRIVDLPTKASLSEGDVFVVDNENGATSKISAASVSGSSTAGLVAEEYRDSRTYEVGEYCIHVEAGIPKLYKCTTAITTAESWTPAHWEGTDAGSEITELNSNLLKLVVLSTSIVCDYADSNTIGYRNTNANKVDVSAISGYPTGSNILAIVPYSTGGAYGAIASIDASGYLHANLKVSGTAIIKVLVLYI